MDLKKKMKHFFTLTRKADGGFTLVELVVVIAILAILAGVGSAGYAGYIKAANKGNDKVLVGNVIRAIETGTYSNSFVSENSFTKGATTYPVGIVILTEDGCTVKASSASKTSTANDPCDIQTMTVVPEGAYSYKTEKYLTALVDIYTVNEGMMKTVEYCATHANICNTKVYTELKWNGPKGEKTYVFEKNCTGVYDLCGNHTDGEVLTTESLSSYGNIVSVDASSGNAIYNSMKAAFGDVDSLALTYSGWGDAEQDGHTYATLLTYTETLIGDIKGTAEALMLAVDVAALAGKDVSEYLTEDYVDAADMMDSFSSYLTSKYATVDAWMTEWNNAANGGTTYAFGLSDTLDYCYAARMSYNTAFASYCSANNVDSKYVEVLKDYHHTNSYGIDIPDVTNTAAFSSTDATDSDTLYAQFIEADSTNGATAFEQCKKLYEAYKNSDACKSNGETFYTTMQTVATTGSEAYNNGDGGNDAYFDYYENLMKEMGAYYEFIKGYGDSGIIILVSVDDGVVNCQVSPSTANPRND